MTGLTRDEWVDRCTQRYLDRSSESLEAARGFAEAGYEQREGWFDLDPEGSADSDMSYWTD